MILTCGPESLRQYAPPVAGNGELSLTVDYEGSQRQEPRQKSYPAIWWAGRRYDTACRELVPFGRFEQEILSKDPVPDRPGDWRQSLDTREACIRSICHYANQLTVESEVLVHAEYNLIMIRKHFQNPDDLMYRFSYRLTQPGPDGLPPRRMTFSSAAGDADGSLQMDYHIDGQQQYHGRICLFADRVLQPDIQGNCISLTARIPAAANPEERTSVSYFLLFQDDLGHPDGQGEAEQQRRHISQAGFAALYQEHCRKWQAYWDESDVQIPDLPIMRSYQASLYHLRCAATRWSIPIAIADTHWHGRYFGFDEFFGFMGLLTSNHLQLARRVPEFRYQGLEWARRRAAGYFPGSGFKNGARYPWETVETGEEAAPPGFWYEHIFHMAHIALEAWQDYLYSADEDFLREKGYPVIKACAEFFFNFAVYVIDGRTVIGKVTDLERLGAGIENAYMTTCSAIAALQAAAAAAGILAADPERKTQWQETACRLAEGLPHDGEKYVPFPGCSQKSIAVLSGVFPYAAVDVANPLQRKAIEDFCSAGDAFGNMYPVGRSVCAWYAAWKTIIFARLHDAGRALAAAAQVAEGAGSFAELFEINEADVSMKPWFSTAEGTFIQGVNEMLIRSDGGIIRIAPAIPDDWKDFSFRLNAQGGWVVTAQAAQGQLVQLKLQRIVPGKTASLSLAIPESLCPPRLPDADYVADAEIRNGVWHLTLDLNQLQINAAADGPLIVI